MTVQPAWRPFAAAAGALLLLVALNAHGQPAPAKEEPRRPDVIFVPTPEDVVEQMLKVANVTGKDVLYDLGSGDGRLVIEAARRYGARGVGVEFEERLVLRSREAAAAAGVGGRVAFRQGDVMAADLRPATVVTMYLLPRLLVKLAPKLRAELRPGTRIVSHDYAIEGWTAEKVDVFDVEEKSFIHGSPRTEIYLYRA